MFHPHAHFTKLPSYMEHHLRCTPCSLSRLPCLGTPVAAAYVKVFSYRKGQGADAAVFHKDGYTDRRGR